MSERVPDVASWTRLAEQLRTAIDAAIPDALLGVFNDDRPGSSILGNTKTITRPIVLRAVEGLDEEDLLALLVEHPELLEHEPHSTWHWQQRRAPQPNHVAPNLADQLRAVVQSVLEKHADRLVSDRVAAVTG